MEDDTPTGEPQVKMFGMCTLTWFDEADGYQVFVNRDESRARGPESPPAIRERRGVRFIAPLDGDFGGTWIAAAASGITLCLLNGDPAHAEPQKRGGYRTRGSLPLGLIDAPSTAAVAIALRAEALDSYRPFVLTAFAPGAPPSVARWDGVALLVGDATRDGPPLISSSFCTEEVRAARRDVYRALVEQGAGSLVDRHLAFHAAHLPERGPASPCMHRTDAHTVSFSWVRVAGPAVEFRYSPRALCHGRPETGVSLA